MENENSIGTVVDRITCSYIKYAVVTNIRSAMAYAIEEGFPEDWSFHVDLVKGQVVWVSRDVPCEVYATPAGGPSLFDTSISLTVEVDGPSNMGASVLLVDKLWKWLESQNLDKGLVMPMEWSGEPDPDALRYLMEIAPILKTIGEFNDDYLKG
tara:strand:- start:520 stop:981 length:462 start_codon:yes stop_codon:yes gene_type:complete